MLRSLTTAGPLQVTAMQIAALKRIGKGSTVLLLDKNGGTAKAIARELASRGFSKVGPGSAAGAQHRPS